ncbi:hypothetical protein TH66_00150 [Carbonactinospora thermoautotrophica]|uniref:Uncharacterized protein n=1 Tax=Carbonactinospora thermoautotrophica TaxID=1469144 RepID=A0A132N730_9ACTN|nr:hypothetical protein [Carbonactinospora thermoautotrophica]KWX04635.1 hypothetical protein TR74_24245 [Carbonactinospora thermoautotrophica]KWX05965.1 hypothetical protein TH66_00150 [Carbonactinospora thermoautotrophica]
MLPDAQFGVDFHVEIPSVQRLEQQITDLADKLSGTADKLAAAAEAASRANAGGQYSQGWPVLARVVDVLTGSRGYAAWLRRVSEELHGTATHIRVQRANYEEGDNDITASMNAVAEQLAHPDQEGR